MTAPPLAIIQARMGSQRFKGKMMAPLAGHPLIYWSWRRSVEAFGEANVVVAIPAIKNFPENEPLKAFLDRIGALVFEWGGPENDVLGRYYFCSHTYRWSPDAVICRVTPDDPLKDPKLMQAVAAGARHPVELSCEATTLQSLTILHFGVTDPEQREHLSLILSPVMPPAPPKGVWSVDCEEDLQAIHAKMEGK